MKIYIKGNRPKTIDELLKRVFIVANPNSSPNFHTSCDTYANKECTIVQCTMNRMRSFDDIYDIVKTYFPIVTPKSVMHKLLSLNIKGSNGKNSYIELSNCGGMGKIRVLYNLYQNISDYKRVYKYDSKYSWDDLVSMLGINNDNELNKYIKKHRK
jgi:hypothetical protein